MLKNSAFMLMVKINVEIVEQFRKIKSLIIEKEMSRNSYSFDFKV